MAKPELIELFDPDIGKNDLYGRDFRDSETNQFGRLEVLPGSQDIGVQSFLIGRFPVRPAVIRRLVDAEMPPKIIENDFTAAEMARFALAEATRVESF